MSNPKDALTREKQLASSSKKGSKNIFEKYDLPLPTREAPEIKVMELRDFMDDDDPELYSMLESSSVDGIYRFDEAIGVTGTAIRGGRIDTDPNPEKRPYIVRGSNSKPGEFEEAFLESNIFRGVTEIRNLLVSGHWSLSLDMDEDEDLTPAQEEHIRHTEWLFKKLEDVVVGDQGLRGVKDLVESISSFLIHGFSVHEVGYERDPETGWYYPSFILFRDQSTVDRWIIDLKKDELAAISFRTGDDHAAIYSLKAGGSKLEDHQVLLHSLNRRGKNYEGISPLRPGLFWKQLKVMLAYIIGVSADLQGVPVRYVRNAFEVLKDASSQMADDDQLDSVLDAIVSLEEGDDTVVKLPNGVEIGILDHEGTLIDVKPLMEYCDLQLAIPFSSEGSLLGQNQVGSYSMAEVSDKQFLSQLPYYQKQISGPINDLVRLITIKNLGHQDKYAHFNMRFDVGRDNTRFVADLIALFQAGFWTWPLPLRQILLDEMGLDSDLFNEWDPEELLSFLQGGQQEEPTSDFGEARNFNEAGGARQKLLQALRKK